MEDITAKFPIINDRYKILNTIGSGGTSTVYEAHDIILDRPVAIKMLNLELASDPELSEKFKSEAKASAKLAHPNIVRTYDYGYQNGRFYIVLELVDGSNFKKEMTNVSNTKNQLVTWIKQACSGLSYAHENGLIHCDIKPQNLLIGKDRILRITDFGISRLLGDASGESSSEVWGSPYYMAPEVVAGKAITPAVDIYAMGVILYEIFTGSLPFSGKDAFELVKKHQSEKIPLPSQINPSVTKQVENIILKCLAKKPELRFKTADELLQSIEKIEIDLNKSKQLAEEIEDASYNQPPSSRETEKQIDWLTVFLGIVALLTIGGLIPFWIFIYFFINR